MPRRRYSDEERAACLAANGGDTTLTARQVGVPETTLRHWANGDRHTEAARLGALTKPVLADTRARAFELAELQGRQSGHLEYSAKAALQAWLGAPDVPQPDPEPAVPVIRTVG